jgi:HlyD family secretion protein
MGVTIAGALLAACAVLPGATSTGTDSASAQNGQNAARVTAETGSIEEKVVGTGSITANTTLDVAFQSAGTIKELLVKVGDQVKAGQVLALLDDSDLKLTAQSQWASYLAAQAAYSATVKGPTSAELKQAQAALSSAQAAYSDLFNDPSETDLVQVRADLQSAEAALKAAQTAYDGAYRRNPAGIGGTSQSLELEQATITYNKAKAAYDALFAEPSKSAVASASAQIQSARASLAALQPISETIEQQKAQVDQAYIAWQQAENKVKQATLTAPMDGLVTAVNFVPGATASSGAAVAQIADFAEPVFVVNIDEADLGAVQVGQDARVRLQTYPDQQIPAKVTSISPIGTSSSGITTYEVKLTIPKTSDTPNILLNMSGTGEIVTTQIEDAVLVPSDALNQSGEGSAREYNVTIAGANGQPETVKVTIGKRTGDKVQILSGISAGDVLIYTPSTDSGSSSTTTQTQQGGFGAPGGGPPPGP